MVRLPVGHFDFARLSTLGGDDNVSPCALDDGNDLGPLGRRDCELVERLCHVIHERVPLARRDAQVPMRALHVLAGVSLRTSVHHVHLYPGSQSVIGVVNPSQEGGQERK